MSGSYVWIILQDNGSWSDIIAVHQTEEGARAHRDRSQARGSRLWAIVCKPLKE